MYALLLCFLINSRYKRPLNKLVRPDKLWNLIVTSQYRNVIDVLKSQLSAGLVANISEKDEAEVMLAMTSGENH